MPQFGGKNAKKTSSDSKRHFTVVMGGKEHGLYVSSTPSSAARKAVTKLCTANKSKKVEFHIREITQGSKKKTYGPYEGYIEKLKEPIELKGRVIKYKPVAKLSEKTGAKKGGMRGGANRLDRSRDFKIQFYKFRYDEYNGFIPIDNIGKPNDGILLESLIYFIDFIDASSIHEENNFIEFRFKSTISDKKIIEVLKSPTRIGMVIKILREKLNLQEDFDAYITIPYIANDGSKKNKRYKWIQFRPERPDAQPIGSNATYSSFAGINSLKLTNEPTTLNQTNRANLTRAFKSLGLEN
jgi:hypothetical protein